MKSDPSERVFFLILAAVMAIILNLETATTNCSVSVAKEGKLLSLRERNSASFSHSELLHSFIEEALHEASIALADLDAIGVSKGPGSYTGLRIGVSAAKGLCFSLDLPLISVPTLESIAHQSKNVDGSIVPVLDARRMEVYSAVFDNNFREIRKTKAEIINENSFKEFAKVGKVHILGSGAKKCQAILKHSNFSFNVATVPSAREMVALSYKKFKAGEFEDVAYFEPSYLKDFILQGKRS